MPLLTMIASEVLRELFGGAARLSHPEVGYIREQVSLLVVLGGDFSQGFG